MAKFKSGKKLWLGVAVILLVALLTFYNISSFGKDLIINTDEPNPGVFFEAVMDSYSINVGALITFIALFLMMSAALLVEFKFPSWLEHICAAMFFICGPWLTFETVKLIIGVGRYESSIYWLNVLFYAVFQVAVFVLTQSTRLSFCISIAVGSLLNFANEIVLLIRGTPLVPTDLYAIGTAMKVTGAADWRFNVDMLTGLCSCVMLIALASQFRFAYPKKWLRPCAAFAAAVVLTVGCCGIYEIDYESFPTSTFDTESTNNVNGTALNFYINVRKMGFDEPEGYSEEKLEEFLSKYDESDYENSIVTAEVIEPSEGGESAEADYPAVIEPDYPNIIVIMNESFSDLSYLGRLRTDIPYMPFFNSSLETTPTAEISFRCSAAEPATPSLSF